MQCDRARGWVVAVLVGVVGCGSTVEDGNAGGGGAGASGPGSTSSTASSAGPCAGKSCGDPCSTCPEPAPCVAQACDGAGQCVAIGSFACTGCPETAPAEQSACDPAGLVCEFEDGPLVECRASATCTASGWLNEAPGCTSYPPPDRACPGTMPSGNCDVAVDPGVCGYGDVICGCTDCFGGPCGGQAQWVCASPPAAPCPAVAPRLGAACTEENLSCLYGSCSLSAGLGGRHCTAGVWVSEDVACPL